MVVIMMRGSIGHDHYDDDEKGDWPWSWWERSYEGTLNPQEVKIAAKIHLDYVGKSPFYSSLIWGSTCSWKFVATVFGMFFIWFEILSSMACAPEVTIGWKRYWSFATWCQCLPMAIDWLIWLLEFFQMATWPLPGQWLPGVARCGCCLKAFLPQEPVTHLTALPWSPLKRTSRQIHKHTITPRSLSHSALITIEKDKQTNTQIHRKIHQGASHILH